MTSSSPYRLPKRLFNLSNAFSASSIEMPPVWFLLIVLKICSIKEEMEFFLCVVTEPTRVDVVDDVGARDVTDGAATDWACETTDVVREATAETVDGRCEANWTDEDDNGLTDATETVREATGSTEVVIDADAGMAVDMTDVVLDATGAETW